MDRKITLDFLMEIYGTSSTHKALKKARLHLEHVGRDKEGLKMLAGETATVRDWLKVTRPRKVKRSLKPDGSKSKTNPVQAEFSESSYFNPTKETSGKTIKGSKKSIKKDAIKEAGVRNKWNQKRFATSDQKQEKRTIKKQSKSRSSKRFVCSQCGTSFTRKGNLLRHKQEQHSKDRYQYVCKGCRQTYVRNEDLMKHEKKCNF